MLFLDILREEWPRFIKTFLSCVAKCMSEKQTTDICAKSDKKIHVSGIQFS